MKQVLFLTALLLLTGCGREVRMSDDDIQILSRYYSPDSSKVLLTYNFDIGALGYSRSWHSILNSIDTTGIINQNVLPDIIAPKYAQYEPLYWIDDNTFRVGLKVQPYIKAGLKPDTVGFNLGGVRFQVELLDPHETRTMTLEHFSISPDKKNLLVAHRYEGVSQIEISVIKFDEEPPKYGNVLTTINISENPILFGRWITNDKIELDINQNSYFADYIELNSKIPIEVSLNKVNFQREYSAILGGWYNKNLYPASDSTVLFNEVQDGTATITQIRGWGDSNYTKLSNFFYEYEHGGETYKSYFRANIDSIEMKINDTLKVELNADQPLIHRLLIQEAR